MLDSPGSAGGDHEVIGMTLRIVHLSKTMLAGFPIALVRALQRHSGYEVRLVDLHRWGRFEHDLVFDEQPEVALDLARSADIIHLHNYLDFDSADFRPIDLHELRRKGTLFVRQFSTHPEAVASVLGQSVSQLLGSPIPSLVLAQFQERYYPAARVAPNIVLQDHPALLPARGEAIYAVAYAPTSDRGAWEERWNTKGVPETLAVLRAFERRTGHRVRIEPLGPSQERVLAERRRSLITIDELVTGSYHRTALEGLCLARATLAFLDQRTSRVLAEIAGTSECPFVNVRLEESLEVLCHLAAHRDEADEIGRDGRRWLDRHWSDSRLVRHYVEAYQMLMTSGQLERQAGLRLGSAGTRFLAVALPDLVYAARASLPRARISTSWRRTLRMTGTAAATLRRFLLKWLPGALTQPARRLWRQTRREPRNS
jgi:hypothetical protein